MIEQRDLLLVPFPFSDQSGKKVRPVVVISKNEFNQHSGGIVVVGITSHLSQDHYTIQLSQDNLEEGFSHNFRYIKVENILKIDKRLVVKKIGRISTATFDAIMTVIKTIIG